MLVVPYVNVSAKSQIALWEEKLVFSRRLNASHWNHEAWVTKRYSLSAFGVKDEICESLGLPKHDVLPSSLF